MTTKQCEFCNGNTDMPYTKALYTGTFTKQCAFCAKED